MKSRLAVGIGFALLFGGTSAWAADKEGCKPPAWAPERMPGFEITDCEHQDWGEVDMQLVDGSKHLQGRVDKITYTLVDESKNPSNEKARNYFAAQGKRSGATLMSDPQGGWSCTLTRKDAQGEHWYEYAHGSGNDESTGSFTLTTVDLGALKQEVVVREAPTDWNYQTNPCKDPPWLVKQFGYFKIDSCSVSDFDQETLSTPDGDLTLAGHFYRVTYALTDPKKNPVAHAVWQNYVDALKGLGAKLVTKPDEDFKALLTRKTPHGEQWFLYEHGSGNSDSTTSYSLTYVVAGGPPPKACTLQIYGVNFDFNKSNLRPDSEPVLKQVLAMFQADASYSAEIGGHTDNVGEKNYNQKLSGERAKAVKDWLVAHGIAPARLTSAGYGDTRPLVPNNSDANRARNRRVELKRVGCKK
ncbi:MAG: OmpA family protein [Deltaproteobacteria bacterium]|nr:OmpA family protein [Deltaproteobacteria bacterium]